jgi:phage terminase large subunit-like protein
MVAALERFYEAVRDGRVGFTPAEDRGEGTHEQKMALGLSRHIINARRAPSRAGLQIRKEFPHSARKIDAAMASVLAYEAASEARAAGVKPRSHELYAARRIR